jgi:predicted Zn-dependent protease
LGKEYSAYVEEMIGVYENPELTAYVKAVGDKLTAVMDRPLFEYKYSILATEEPNAFSIPGGHLYVTTGMFPFLESEDELACIMAHEIIHANNRHVIKSNRRGIIPGILQIPGAIIGAVVDENLGNAMMSPFAKLGSLTHASYNRRQEIEADVEGIEIAARAGYNPDALKSILSRLGRFGEIVSGEEETKDRYATHPLTDQRVEKINKTEPKLEIVESPPVVEQIYEKIEGALVGSNPVNGVVVDSTFIHPSKNFSVSLPGDWETGLISNMIAAVGPNDDFLRIVYEESVIDPSLAAAEFSAQLNPVFRDKILGSEAILVGDKKGHMLVFTEQYEEKTYYGSKTWVKHDSLLFNFLSISTTEDHSTTESVIGSLGRVSEEDKMKIKVPVLRFVSTLQGETLEDLLSRTGSDLSPELTRLINKMEASEKLVEGEEVKVVISEQFEY